MASVSSRNTFVTASGMSLNPEPSSNVCHPRPDQENTTSSCEGSLGLWAGLKPASLPSPSPPVHDAAAQAVPVALQVRDGERRQAPDREPLVLPRQHILSQVDLLVHHGKLHLWELAGNNLRTRGSYSGVLPTAECHPAVPCLPTPTSVCSRM